MITIDITMVIQIANIVILIVIMNTILYKPIRNILEQREKKLAELEDDISTFNKNAQRRLEEFDSKLNDARKKAKAEMDGLRGEATQAANEKIAAIRAESDSEKSDKVSQIKDEFAKAQQELQGQIDGFASAMAEKVLGRSL